MCLSYPYQDLCPIVFACGPINMWRAVNNFVFFSTDSLWFMIICIAMSFLPDHPVHYKHVSHQSHHTDERVESRDANGDDESCTLPACNPAGLVALRRHRKQILIYCNIERSYGDRVPLAEIVREKSGELHCSDSRAKRAQRLPK